MMEIYGSGVYASRYSTWRSRCEGTQQQVPLFMKREDHFLFDNFLRETRLKVTAQQTSAR